MHVSIKSRIYYGFYSLAALFLINASITVITLQRNWTLSEHITEVADPSLQGIYDFRKLLSQSEMYSTNWVFIGSHEQDKIALRKLHDSAFPELRKQLYPLSEKWTIPSMRDTLQSMLNCFGVLIDSEKQVMQSLAESKDYANPFKFNKSKELVETEVIPRTAMLTNSLDKLLTQERAIRIQEQATLENNYIILTIVIGCLSIIVLIMGIFLSRYFVKTIVAPINKIIFIVRDLGKGIIRKVDHTANGDEMGEMIRAVDCLSDSLMASASFAYEIGVHNFNVDFTPISEDDTLGKALVAMRDNLKSTNARLNEAQNIAHLGSWERDLKTNHFIWSAEIFRIFEVDPSTFDPHLDSISRLIHPDDVRSVTARMEQMLKDREPYSCEFRIITPKGNTKTVYLQSKPLMSDNQKVLKTFGTLQDISEQKQAEIALQNAHRQMQVLFENIEEVFFSFDMVNFQLLQMSPACERVYGYPREDFYANPNLWYEKVYDDDKKIVDANQVLMAEGKPVVMEYRFHHKDGSIHWFETKITSTLNKSGTLVRLDGLTSDITGRREAEETLKAYNVELKKTNAELDKFVYSVSHDLRAPLTSMLGVIELSEAGVKEATQQKHLAMLKRSVKKLDSFILDILDYSRNARTEIKKEEINFTELLSDITDNLKYMSGTNRHVDIHVQNNNGKVFTSDKGRLSIVLNNLISNAIRYQNPTIEAPFVKINMDSSEGGIIISIKDNGIGISEENQLKVFDMFYRISEKSVGSGLGLYIVKETIDKLKGTITINSELGKGTEFIIHVPNN